MESQADDEAEPFPPSDQPSSTRADRVLRQPGPLTLVSIAYLTVATAIMVWRRLVVTPDYLLLLLIPIGIASGRVLRFIGDWIPFVVLLLGWEAMRGLAGQTGLPVHSWALHVDQSIFGQVPTVALQRWAHALAVDWAINPLATIAYFLHFPVTVAVGVALWLFNRSLFLQYSIALLGMSFAAFVVFLIFPTAPPWWDAMHGQFSGMWRVFQYTLPSSLSPLYRSFDPNPVAALPSLHAAYPFLGFLALRKLWRVGSLVALSWCIVIWFGVVYLGEHYVFDVAVGIAWAGIAWLITDRFLSYRIRALGALVDQSTTARGNQQLRSTSPAEVIEAVS